MEIKEAKPKPKVKSVKRSEGVVIYSSISTKGKHKELKMPTDVENFFKKELGIRAVAFIITDPDQPGESFVIVPKNIAGEEVDFNLSTTSPNGGGCGFVDLGGGQRVWRCF